MTQTTGPRPARSRWPAALTGWRLVIAAAALIAVFVGIVGSCQDSGRKQPSAARAGSGSVAVEPQLTVQSTAFGDGEPIPPRYLCGGAGVFPPLSWANAPVDTAEYAILVIDPYAQKDVFWVASGIPATVTHLGEGELPAGVRQGQNSEGTVGWLPPCPPPGQMRGYTFNVFALSQPVQLTPDTPAGVARDAVIKAAIAQATVTGTAQGIPQGAPGSSTAAGS